MKYSWEIYFQKKLLDILLKIILVLCCSNLNKKEVEKKQSPPKKDITINPPTKNCISLYYAPDSINKQKDSLFERYEKMKIIILKEKFNFSL